MIGPFVTDESFAVNMADAAAKKATPHSMIGVGLIAWVGWMTGTFIGATAAEFIGDPSRLGVDFAMTAMFSALFVALAEDRRHVMIGLLAAALVTALPFLQAELPFLSRSWHVIIASMLAATLATVVWHED